MSANASGSDEGSGVPGVGGTSGAVGDSVSLGNPLLVKRAPEKLEPLTILDTTLRDGERCV